MGEAIIGVIGTLLGTLLGWILGRIDFGKLTVSFNNTIYNFSALDELSYYPGFKPFEIYQYEISTTMQLYNSSSTNQVVRNVQFIFCDDKRDILSIDAKDDDTRQFVARTIRYEDMEIANIPSYTGIDLKIRVYTNDIDTILKTKKIMIQYKNQKLKTKRVFLKNVDYSNQPRFVFPEEDTTNA